MQVVKTFVLLFISSCLFSVPSFGADSTVGAKLDSFLDFLRNPTFENKSDCIDCQSANQCPPALEDLHANDQEHRLSIFGASILKSQYQACIKAVDRQYNTTVSRFDDPKSLKNFLAQKYKNWNQTFHFPIWTCSSKSSAETNIKVSKYYYYLDRYSRGIDSSLEELSSVNAILGSSPLTKGLHCDKQVFPDAIKRCQELAACPANANAKNLDLMAAKSKEAGPKYQDLLNKMKLTNQSCSRHLNEIKKHEVDIQKQGTKKVCTQTFSKSDRLTNYCVTYDKKDLEKIKSCQEQIASIQMSLTIQESTFPWFKDPGYFESIKNLRTEKDAIRESLIKTKAALLGMNRDIVTATDCLRRNKSCSTESLRSALNMTPEIPEVYGKDPFQNTLNSYYFTQQCLENGVADINKTAGTISRAGFDAGIGLVTLGIGTYIMGGIRGITAASKLTSAAQGSWGMAHNFAAVTMAVDAVYFAESYREMQKACSKEIKVALGNAASKNSCPQPTLQSEIHGADVAACTMAKTFAVIDGLALIPGARLIKEVASRHNVAPNISFNPNFYPRHSEIEVATILKRNPKFQTKALDETAALIRKIMPSGRWVPSKKGMILDKSLKPKQIKDYSEVAIDQMEDIHFKRLNKNKTTLALELNTLDPKIRKTLTAVFNANRDSDEYAKYWDHLLKATLVEMTKSSSPKAIQSLSRGEVYYPSLLKVLSDRAKARGVKLKAMKGTDEEKFRDVVRSGGFIDYGLGTNNHGRDSHLLQLDYTASIIEREMKGPEGRKEFFEFLATDTGISYWEELFDSINKSDFSRPEIVNDILKIHNPALDP